MEDLVKKARDFAEVAHFSQKRKYTFEPYFVHCEEVANIVRSAGGTPEMIAAAYLHDTIEDTGTKLEEIRDKFGPTVAALVWDLTDQATRAMGNRAVRKAFERDRLAKVSAQAQTIKTADLISNTSTIAAHDPDFAKVYLQEKRLLLDAMDKADPTLRAKAYELVSQ